MACLTFDFLGVGMGPPQREICPFMIECLFGDWGDILRPTLMLRVALFAVSLLLQPSMRTLLGLDILSRVFVTIKTENILRRLVESLVTLRTIFFPLRMAFNHLTGHQSRLDVVRPDAGRNACRQAHDQGGGIAVWGKHFRAVQYI